MFNLAPGSLVGLFLVLAGTLLFVDNLGVLPFRAVRLIWPGLLVVWGGIIIARRRSPAMRVWGGAAIVGGILVGLQVMGVIWLRGSVVWPLALIAAGVAMLMSRLEGGGTGRLGWQAGSPDGSRGSENRLQEQALFSGVKRRVDSSFFEGGDLTSMFGGIEIDLRRAAINGPERRAVIEVNVAFGGVEIRVPDDWRVSIEGNAAFGAFEDKTIPPRPEPGVQIPVLVVKGSVVFGATVVQN